MVLIILRSEPFFCGAYLSRAELNVNPYYGNTILSLEKLLFFTQGALNTLGLFSVHTVLFKFSNHKNRMLQNHTMWRSRDAE